jgi:hypothetical protein
MAEDVYGGTISELKSCTRNGVIWSHCLGYGDIVFYRYDAIPHKFFVNRRQIRRISIDPLGDHDVSRGSPKNEKLCKNESTTTRKYDPESPSHDTSNPRFRDVPLQASSFKFHWTQTGPPQLQRRKEIIYSWEQMEKQGVAIVDVVI